jgi:hypothetical protein
MRRPPIGVRVGRKALGSRPPISPEGLGFQRTASVNPSDMRAVGANQAGACCRSGENAAPAIPGATGSYRYFPADTFARNFRNKQEYLGNMRAGADRPRARADRPFALPLCLTIAAGRYRDRDRASHGSAQSARQKDPRQGREPQRVSSSRCSRLRTPEAEKGDPLRVPLPAFARASLIFRRL